VLFFNICYRKLAEDFFLHRSYSKKNICICGTQATMGFSQGMQLFGTNLLKFKLSNTTRDVRVAVDISGWIHAISSKAKNPDSSFDVEKIIRLTVLRLIYRQLC
jgi:hypothetical protein